MKSRTMAGLLLLVLFSSLFGVYYVGLLDAGSFWTTTAAVRVYVLSYFKPVCQQVTFAVHQIKEEEFPLSGTLVKRQRQADAGLGAALDQIHTLQGELRELQQVLHHVKWGAKDLARRALGEALKHTELPGMTALDVQKFIGEVQEKVDYNQVQMPDFARKSSGATIIHSKTSASFLNTKGILFWTGLPLIQSIKSPDVILETENQPGNCWAFSGSQGHVFIKLSKAISPHAVTLQHIAVSVSPRGDVTSAPKDFAVYGMKDEKEEQGLFLGEFTYSLAEHPFQTFWLKNERSDSVRYVKLEVLSNWGHPEYTCLYRVRVHGEEP